MGTDFVQLLDRRTAELILIADEADLVTLVEARTRPNSLPPVWRNRVDLASFSLQPFGEEATIADRLAGQLAAGSELVEIKTELIDELCTSDWIYLDYWGCMAEVFTGAEPPGASYWENFTAAMFEGPLPEEPGLSGRYLLTASNIDAMTRSLRKHVHELDAMRERDVEMLERWHEFCGRHSDYRVVYQIDF